MSKHFELSSSDDQPIYVRYWLPEGEPRAVIQIAHGMAEHGGRYAWLAAQFNQAGYAVYMNDHRGHGKTVAAQQGSLGFFAERKGWQRVVDDVHDLNQHIRQLHPGIKVALLGHSMGSHIGQSYLICYGHSVDAAMLSGTNGAVGPARYAGIAVAWFERWRLGAKAGSRLLDMSSYDAFNKPFKPARTRFDWLSRDEKQVDDYVNDPFCGFSCSTQMWLDLFGGIGFNQQDRRLQAIPKELPLYLITGDQDSSNNAVKGVEALRKRYQKAGLKNIKTCYYADGRHEMFNEINRQEVANNTVEWFNYALNLGEAT